MEMNRFRPELHVAQQSRRDKLRVPQSLISPHHLEDFPDNLEQLPVHLRLNPDLVQVRNVNNASLLYDPAAYSSDMVNYSVKPNVFLVERNTMVNQEINAAEIERPSVADYAPFVNAPRPISPNFINPLPKASIEPHASGIWKSLASQQSGDWMLSCASGSVGSDSIIPSPMFFGEVSNTSYPKYSKPTYSEFHDVRSSLKNPGSEISSQDRQKHSREMHFTSAFYQNSLHDAFTSASNRTQGLEMVSQVKQNSRGTAHGAREEGGNELTLLPACGNQSDVLCLDDAGAWTNKSCHQWSGQLGFAMKKSDGELSNVVSDSNPQGLSLTLSSNPTSKLPVAQFGEGCGLEDINSRTAVSKDARDLKSGYICSGLRPPSIISKGCGKSLQGIVGLSTSTCRNTGPLGPFTGYATILMSSKFLKPAQQLLDEFCGITSSKLVKTCGVSGEVSTSGDALNATESEIGAVGNNSGTSSSTFHNSNEINGDAGVGSSSCESFRPEYQQKKAKLLYMQEEVCRRYKQYHQQMQMVVSSFESVAGLSSATPYISLALKSITRHFQSLKNAIADQLKHIRKAMGEDLSSPTTGASSSKGDAKTPKLKYLDQSLQRNKYGGGNVGFLETQHHIWKPQRGLPERSVAILRAWLFEHFLHPYPTDTDKHMLATQTGLSRNQVSNWFINARVRVWKPMVEEIHMLETRGLAEPNQNSSQNDQNVAAGGTCPPDRDQHSNNLSINAMPNKQIGCFGAGSSLGNGNELNAEQWNREKRSRTDCQIPTSVDGSLMGFAPYQRHGLEIGGLGTVSLTLGLRHGAENAQHQQQLLQRQDGHIIGREFGGGIIHDFGG